MLLIGLEKLLSVVSAVDGNLRSPLVISLGAIPGALCRYYITIYFAQWLGTAFPFGTLFANVTGSIMMGCFVTYLLQRAIAAPDLRLLVAVGFLGSYTTFSTYTLDTVNLWQVNRLTSIVYGSGSAILGVIGLQLGSLLAQKLP